ncbi:Coenzyme F420 hydrogenase/dehydrogenase, beta subunit C-terminal domain [Desulfovibrio sp. OttesenSCG-928-M16]|nr:Coenzyme F420 hydrogenase/dehydrogenase, beta subunit C-terminal domain [Desulfovibrio sp. OttesenSCG-928-M16]
MAEKNTMDTTNSADKKISVLWYGRGKFSSRLLPYLNKKNVSIAAFIADQDTLEASQELPSVPLSSIFDYQWEYIFVALRPYSDVIMNLHSLGVDPDKIILLDMVVEVTNISIQHEVDFDSAFLLYMDQYPVIKESFNVAAIKDTTWMLYSRYFKSFEPVNTDPSVRKVGYMARTSFNYGGTLQAFALQYIVTHLGYRCEFLDFKQRAHIPGRQAVLSASRQRRWESLFADFWRKHFLISTRLCQLKSHSTTVLPEAQTAYDAYLTGSDFIWNVNGPFCYAKNFLAFAPEGKRVAYAPSLGRTRKIKAEYAGRGYWFKRLVQGMAPHISCREDVGATLLRNLADVSVEHVVDPTFLLSAQDWAPVMEGAHVPKKAGECIENGDGYLLAYILDPDTVKENFAESLSVLLKLRVIWLSGRSAKVGKNLWETCPAGFLTLCRHAAFICTDSMHGVAFSLIFKKNFLFLDPASEVTNGVRRTTDPRISELLDLYALHDRVPNLASPPVVPEIPNFPHIDSILARRKEDSLAYLRKALEEAVATPPPPLKEEEQLPSLEGTRRVPLPDLSQCTGCAACFNACPDRAVSMHEGASGYLQPHVNEELCTECGACARSCPILHRPTLPHDEDVQVFAAWNENKDIRRKSSSGGMMPALVEGWAFRNGGVAAGVQFDAQMRAHFGLARNVQELQPFYGSKYVQADPGMVYREIQEHLERQRHVLFVGTPCQAAGLHAFLGTEHPQLLTVDLFCHGVPSPLLLRKYLQWCEAQYGAHIKNIWFRSKDVDGWSISLTVEFYDGRVIYFPRRESGYFGLFTMKSYFLHPACFHCKFKGIDRISDISLGDFWGIDNENSLFKHDVRQGVSAVVARTKKGKDVLLSLYDAKNIFLEKRTLDELKKSKSHYMWSPQRPIGYSEVMEAFTSSSSFGETFDLLMGDSTVREIASPLVLCPKQK